MADMIVSSDEAPDIPFGEIVARGVSSEDYTRLYAANFYEWVKGYVIKMPPVTAEHDHIIRYVRLLIDAYFALRPIGETLAQPFVMVLEAVGSRREPDLQVILKSNSGKLTPTAMLGPADICIEVVSPESAKRDHGEKYIEYEAGGVQEYWIIDPLRQECRFCRLQSSGVYALMPADTAGNYESPLLPGLRLPVPVLWQKPLPDPVQTVIYGQHLLNQP